MAELRASDKTDDQPSSAGGSQSQDEPSNGLLPGQHWTQSAQVNIIQEQDHDDDDRDSTFSDNASSIASLSSDILRYREINGRRYHSEQGDAQYWVSNDSQSNEALDINHHVLILMYNDKLYKAPLKDDIQAAVDIGTGTGIWAMDFADEFPNAKVVGIDISPIQPSWLPPNLEFQIDDCTQEWTFKENSLDYVHMRFLVGSIVDWPALFKQAYKCLKSGGYVESHEGSPCIGSDDGSVPENSAMGQWGKIFMEGGRKLQRPFSILEDDIQVQAMKEAGFVNIKEEEIKVPIGAWPDDPKLKEAGQYFQAAILQDVEGTLMFIANLLGWTKEEIHVFAAQYRREIRSKTVHGYFRAKVVWAQKPIEN
ncbi:phosphoethanolamine n-methyltransferase 3 [Fusarium beomiforme]|uniref:Phosphoethanolamine n-methyltransferase 3 n=1 Tax=Fusarium beomiforme TaxID=44412 RepID=A0A9P5ATP8_9HYPO|nr:phosphoethanolamine n-methyltransferase 3 [Fusarium beomiforme]